MGFIKAFRQGLSGNDFTYFKGGKLCKNCNHIGIPEKKTPGHFMMEVILWLFFLLPGLIYSLWRLTNKFYACANCSSKNLVPVDDKAVLGATSGGSVKKCPDCAETVQGEAKVCRFCRHQFAA